MGSQKMGPNEHDTERLLRQSSPKYGQYQSGIGPGHKNKTNRKTTYVTAKTPLPAIRRCKTRTHRSIKSFTRKVIRAHQSAGCVDGRRQRSLQKRLGKQYMNARPVGFLYTFGALTTFIQQATTRQLFWVLYFLTPLILRL